MSSGVVIRKAREDDAEYVAKTVLTALDMDSSGLERVKLSCADPRSMYSWNKSLIAEADGKPIGCIISYPGDNYKAMREYTWSRIWKDIDMETIKNSAIETYPSEYYLDSLAIEPEYRGKGLGKSLMLAAMERGRQLGYERFALIVSFDKPRLKDYYAGLGFKVAEDINFFGHTYHRMIKDDII